MLVNMKKKKEIKRPYRTIYCRKNIKKEKEKWKNMFGILFQFLDMVFTL